MSQARVLLYNFTDQERLRQIRRYLNKAKISVRMVQAPEFLETLGYLFEMPGFSKTGAFNLGGNFREEMLVMKDFSEKEMDDFFSFFRENSLPPVGLKAVLTPITVHWTSLQLYEELSKERASFENI